MADVARSIAIKHYRMPLDVVQKSDLSPVTIADQSIEGALRDLIRAHAPEVAIIGEEMANEGTGNQAVIIDPIDGTKSFITGHPLFGTLIAFAENGLRYDRSPGHDGTLLRRSGRGLARWPSDPGERVQVLE